MRRTLAAIALSLAAPHVHAQTPAEPHLAPLFASETPLAVTLTANLKRLRGDRNDQAPWRGGAMAYTDADGKTVTVPTRVRTRGIWRLKHCEFPPLRLDFDGKTSKHTLLDKLGKPKLVSYCRNNDQYEQYVLQELQLYRVYRLLTPASHHVRLLRTTYTDSATGKAEATRWAFLVEDVADVAKRLDGIAIEQKGGGPGSFDPYGTALAFVFQYMIGNTDFSFSGLHNAEVIAAKDGSRITPIAYDFDFSGAVDATYATVDPVLAVKKVRDRQFRGYCAAAAEYPKVFERFRQQKDAIYALYRDEVGKLLSPRTVKETLAYFDEFYATIANPRTAERDMLSSCVGPR
jgi:hypothetical protein